jgi:hypothetical protein
LQFRVEDVSKPAYPFEDRPQTTLCHVHRHVNSVPSRLCPNKDTIARILRQNGIAGVDLEIVFFEKCFRPLLFSIMGDDPAVRVYDAARRKILALVKTRLCQEWLLPIVFQNGPKQSKKHADDCNLRLSFHLSRLGRSRATDPTSSTT